MTIMGEVLKDVHDAEQYLWKHIHTIKFEWRKLLPAIISTLNWLTTITDVIKANHSCKLLGVDSLSKKNLGVVIMVAFHLKFRWN